MNWSVRTPVENSVVVNFSEIEKDRRRLQAMRDRVPAYEQSWIASAKLEERSGLIPEARKLLLEGCENCPKSEDLWLEAVRLAVRIKWTG